MESASLLPDASNAADPGSNGASRTAGGSHFVELWLMTEAGSAFRVGLEYPRASVEAAAARIVLPQGARWLVLPAGPH